ncbi:hypothetical protein WNY37_12160 [Henriciella sp. AS95]|uniref:hypothetical protein n=1 Tax=Henriciella sp. AS95 TaxID=3135782 RepID=UPI00316F266F
MRTTFSLAIIACAALAACSSQGEKPDVAAPVQSAPSSFIPATNVVPTGGLGPQQLGSRECALFLWSKTDATQLIFFEKAQSGTATMKLGTETVNVVQTRNSGEIFGQFLTEQGFAGPAGEQIVVSVVPGDQLDGGQRVESGKLSITTTEQWTTVIPVLGVRACQP